LSHIAYQYLAFIAAHQRCLPYTKGELSA